MQVIFTVAGRGGLLGSKALDPKDVPWPPGIRGGLLPSERDPVGNRVGAGRNRIPTAAASAHSRGAVLQDFTFDSITTIA